MLRSNKMETADHILLTGAGFTHNFGAPLAADVWSLVLGHPAIDGMSRVRERLLRNFDFESVYHTVLSTSDYLAEEKEAIRDAVSDAYKSLDDGLRSWNSTPGAPRPVNINRVHELVKRFEGTREKPGFIFTLNQDLFMERYYPSEPPLLLLGFNRTVHLSCGRQGTLNAADYIQLPDPPSLEQAIHHNTFFYVKLHGSYNWYASDRTRRMVIGHGKASQIATEPLLAAYLEVFERVLSSGKKRLLIIGYGFRDEHVNAAIADAVDQGNLELFVMSPQSPSSMKALLRKAPCGPKIWSALYGYYPHPLLTLFPQNQDDTPEWRYLRRSFFGELV